MSGASVQQIVKQLRQLEEEREKQRKRVEKERRKRKMEEESWREWVYTSSVDPLLRATGEIPKKQSLATRTTSPKKSSPRRRSPTKRRYGSPSKKKDKLRIIMEEDPKNDKSVTEEPIQVDSETIAPENTSENALENNSEKVTENSVEVTIDASAEDTSTNALESSESPENAQSMENNENAVSSTVNEDELGPRDDLENENKTLTTKKKRSKRSSLSPVRKSMSPKKKRKSSPSKGNRALLSKSLRFRDELIKNEVSDYHKLLVNLERKEKEAHASKEIVSKLAMEAYEKTLRQLNSAKNEDFYENWATS